MNEEDKEQHRKHMQTMAVYITLPFILGIPPIVGLFIGSWLDKYFGIAPYAMYFLLFLGSVAGIKECYKIIKEHKDEDI